MQDFFYFFTLFFLFIVSVDSNLNYKTNYLAKFYEIDWNYAKNDYYEIRKWEINTSLSWNWIREYTLKKWITDEQ